MYKTDLEIIQEAALRVSLNVSGVHSYAMRQFAANIDQLLTERNTSDQHEPLRKATEKATAEPKLTERNTIPEPKPGPNSTEADKLKLQLNPVKLTLKRT